MKIGIWELLVILGVALFVIGPEQLPKYAKMLGSALNEFKKSTSSIQKELGETMKPIKEAANIFKDTQDDLGDISKDLKKTVNEPYKEADVSNEENSEQA